MSNVCPGTASESAGKADGCEGCPNKAFCSEENVIDPDIATITTNLSHIKLIIPILSGKGGVGKSTISRNLSQTFSQHNYRTLLIDFDVAGPSIPRITNTLESLIFESNNVLYPIMVHKNLYCISVGHFISDPSKAMNSKYKTDIIKKILKEICVKHVDVIFIDTPPGVSDEHLALINYLKANMAIIVTTPQRICIDDVRRQIDFCRKARIEIHGLIENMRQIVCGMCGHRNVLYDGCGVGDLCKEMNINYLGSIDMKQDIAKKSDQGLFVEHPVYEKITNQILQILKYTQK